MIMNYSNYIKLHVPLCGVCWTTSPSQNHDRLQEPEPEHGVQEGTTTVQGLR